MKIAVFYPSNAAWSITNGIVPTLKKMGHTVTDCGTNTPALDHELIIVSGPEYLWRTLREAYPDWDAQKCAKVGWLHETVQREDYATNPIAVNGVLPVDILKKLTPKLFTGAIQDQNYGMEFLPCGVDADVFYPRKKNKDYDSIYTGALYPKRLQYLDKYRIRERAGYRQYDTVEEYAEALAKATVVLNLPTLSSMSTARVFEVLASGTALISPALEHQDGLFLDGYHLLYYKADPKAMYRISKYKHEALAHNGLHEVLEKHTMVHRLTKILSSV